MLEFSYCCSLSAGAGDDGAGERDLVGIGLAGRTTESVTVLPGLPSSMRRMTASDSSRVDWSPMDSITSPSARCSLSAGEPGTTLTMVA